MSKTSGQNGKGDKRRPGNEDAYRENWDIIFGKTSDICGFCGEIISPNDFTDMRAYRVGRKAYHITQICQSNLDKLDT